MTPKTLASNTGAEGVEIVTDVFGMRHGCGRKGEQYGR